MTQDELFAMDKHTNDGVFPPVYEYESYNQETGVYTGLVIIKTAEEVYAEYLANKNKQIDICPKPTEEERITQLEADKEALAQNVYMLAEVLEALLGGEEDGQEELITEDTEG